MDCRSDGQYRTVNDYPYMIRGKVDVPKFYMKIRIWNFVLSSPFVSTGEKVTIDTTPKSQLRKNCIVAIKKKMCKEIEKKGQNKSI